MRRGCGFTLIELVLTMVIISAGLFGLLSVFDAASRGAVQGQVYQTAMYLASERLEIITGDKVYRGYGYVTGANYPAVEAIALGTGQWSRILAIQEVSGADFTTPLAGSGYKRVDVTISWGVGPQNQVNLATVLSQY